jgi:hypothetical protein
VDNSDLNEDLRLFRSGDEQAFSSKYKELKTPVYTII